MNGTMRPCSYVIYSRFSGSREARRGWKGRVGAADTGDGVSLDLWDAAPLAQISKSTKGLATFACAR